MKFEGNEIILEHGSISVSANWCGGPQVYLEVSLFIDSTEKHYDFDSIEMAFIEYERITGECHE